MAITRYENTPYFYTINRFFWLLNLLAIVLSIFILKFGVLVLFS